MLCMRPPNIKDIWTPTIGESLLCEREPGNSVDPYEVAMIRLRSGSVSSFSGTVVGRIPLKISAACNPFLCKNGDIRNLYYNRT